MNGVAQIQLGSFLLVYVLLLVVLGIMKKCRINQTKLLVLASARMTLQLIAAGYALTFLFEHPHPLLTMGYLAVLVFFTIYLVLSRNKRLNPRFRVIVSVSIASCGLGVIVFFVSCVVGQSLFDPQYMIPISGMLMGNALTGVSLGLKSFWNGLEGQRARVEALLNVGATPEKVLFPFVCQALETALVPTLNSMLGMGIVVLPGMMTGQILAGVSPIQAVRYQVVVLLMVTAAAALSSFISLRLVRNRCFTPGGALRPMDKASK